jgi:hypothetical protein
VAEVDAQFDEVQIKLISEAIEDLLKTINANTGIKSCQDY